MDKQVIHNILVTGKKSYIGNSLIEYIVKHQFPARVESVSMRNTSYKNLDFSKYSSIVHVSGIVHQKNIKSSYDECYQVNVEKTYEIASIAKKAGVKQFVYLSSMAIYGEEVTRITKETVPNPRSIYGKTKLIAENKLLELENNNFKIAIIRAPMVYGKGCPGNYKLLSKLAKIIPVFPEYENKRSMIYIDNLCRFLWEILSKEHKGIYHPQNREYVNTFTLVREIANCHGHKVRGVKCFNSLICYLSRHVNVISKVFGDCIYDNTVSTIGDMQFVEFSESVKRSEINNLDL